MSWFDEVEWWKIRYSIWGTFTSVGGESQTGLYARNYDAINQLNKLWLPMQGNSN
jgi:hypothetical protein